MAAAGHHFLTVCAAMPADREFGFAREDDVERLIEGLGNPAKPHIRTALDATGIVHFVSLHVVRGRRDDEGSFLVLEATVDGSRTAAINALLKSIGDELLVIFRRACGVDTRSALKELLHRRSLNLSQSFLRPPGAVVGLPFDGVAGLSVKRIYRDSAFASVARDAIYAKAKQKPDATALEYLDAVGDAAEHESEKIGEADDDDLLFVDSADAPWLEPVTNPSILDYVRLSPGILTGVVLLLASLTLFTLLWFVVLPTEISLTWIVSILVGAALSLSWSIPLALVIVGICARVAYTSLRRSEKLNKPNDLDPDPARIAALAKRENDAEHVQNHMISIAPLIDEPFRRWITLPFAFRTIRTAAERRLFRSGFLSGIGTIHFARWFVLPGTRRLVFVSNYDGNWESYLEDFITKASVGLTAVWSNGIGFPKTRLLFMEGAKDGDRFKRWARRTMAPTLFWYSAYPMLTTQEIRTNALIRDGLRKVSTATEAEAWLELFGSIPRPETSLELDEIQKLVLSSVKLLPEGRCLGVAFGSEKSGANWLKKLIADKAVSYAETHCGASAMGVALTASGMRKLGVKECELDRPERGRALAAFHAPFVLGMQHPTRARILNDLDASAEKDWQWGGSANQVDAVRLIYAGADNIDEVMRTELERMSACGVRVVTSISLKSFGKNKKVDQPDGQKQADPLDYEPFGFADGLSQPNTRKGSSSNPLHDVEPGEFILGYRDSRGYFPPTLLLPSRRDKFNLLPGPPSHLPKRWPQFRRANIEQSTRDLGRNGSFLVIRQLEQNVPAFKAWLEKEAKDHFDDDVETLEAKLMGRGRNGVSTIAMSRATLGEEALTTTPDNDFLYGRDDPQGHACPFGAHIRRANPRDSLNPGDKEEISIVNRHRLLRRGRSYQAGNKEGTLFMCFNADIERQFEFVQQNWINSSSHHGLRDECDPIASHYGIEKTISMPSTLGPPKQIKRPEPFVTLRGGGYFFMPSRSALEYLSRSLEDALGEPDPENKDRVTLASQRDNRRPTTGRGGIWREQDDDR